MVVKREILIVNEILPVGDAQFQKKSKKQMLELMGKGTHILGRSGGCVLWWPDWSMDKFK